MKSRVDILKDAINTGEVIKIRYYGGSEPGMVREIAPKKILNGKHIRCFDVLSGIEKTFFLDKIEIDGMAPVEQKLNFKKTEILTNAIKTGETLRIKWYKNGLGTIYNIKALRISGTKVIGKSDTRKLRAYDFGANRIHIFNIDTIKIPEDYETNDVPFDESTLPKLDVELDSFTDERDGKKYKTFKFSYTDEKTLKIKTDIWMAENLAYNAEDSRCYDDDPKNEEKYGRLYDWNKAKNSCPVGWRLPNETDWNRLIKYAVTLEANGQLEIKDYDYAGKQLKSKEGWSNFFGKSMGNGNDAIGFNALPGGMSNKNLYGCGYWWSEKTDTKDTINNDKDDDANLGKNDERNEPCFCMDYLRESIMISYFRKTWMLSVRCIKTEDKK